MVAERGLPMRRIREWGPTPRLPSRSAPVPVNFENGGDHEAGGASCPSGFEGQLFLRRGVAPGPTQPALVEHVAI
jgi:hypothetical protein